MVIIHTNQNGLNRGCSRKEETSSVDIYFEGFSYKEEQRSGLELWSQGKLCVLKKRLLAVLLIQSLFT